MFIPSIPRKWFSFTRSLPEYPPEAIENPSPVPPLEPPAAPTAAVPAGGAVSVQDEHVAGAEATQETKPQDQRRYQRFPANDAAHLKLIHPTTSEPMGARIVDVSKEGMRVRLALQLEPGTTVEIRLPQYLVFAEVRYCRASDAGFYVGVQIQDVLPRRGVIIDPMDSMPFRVGSIR